MSPAATCRGDLPRRLDAASARWYPVAVLYEPRLHVILHQPEIPPNTGAVGRTCVAVGAKLWLVRPLGFRIDEKTRRRAGLDYWEFLEWEVVDRWEQVEDRLGERRFWFFSKSGSRSIWDIRFAAGDAMVFGSETSGLPPSMLARYADKLLRIPIRPQVRSLNLSNSVAIAAYEACRQMEVGTPPDASPDAPWS